MFGEILIPPAVYHEVVVEGQGRPGAIEVEKASCIKVNNIGDKGLVRTLTFLSDEGEAEALVLALEVDADIVLLDDREARLQAKRLGLRVTGTLGILLRAKKLGLIMSIKRGT